MDVKKIKKVTIGGGIVKSVLISNDSPFVLFAGPCQLQSRDLALKICEKLVKITDKLGIKYVFKASFDKANRSSIDSPRGIGIESGIKIFDEIRKTFNVPVLTDVHTSEMPDLVKDYVDVIQQPAFLIRQTDLSIAIAKTKKVCNLKKGQFLSPAEMNNVIKKFESSGNCDICLTERGFSFGYNDLVLDPRSLVIMSMTGYPVIIDATHSVQQPSAMGTYSGGNARMAPFIARVALSTGLVGGVFAETHPEPLKGGSDIQNMIPLMYMEELLKQWQEIDNVSKHNLSRYNNWDQNGINIDQIIV